MIIYWSLLGFIHSTLSKSSTLFWCGLSVLAPPLFATAGAPKLAAAKQKLKNTQLLAAIMGHWHESHERGILLKSSSVLGLCHMMDHVLLIKWHHQCKSTTSFLNLNSQSELLLLYGGCGHLKRLSNKMLPFKAKLNVSEHQGCSLLHTTIQLPLEQFSKWTA